MPMPRLQPGFSDPVHQAQQVFRQILGAMAQPGTLRPIDLGGQGAPGLSAAATAVCLSLIDFETPVWLDRAAAEARDYLVFHCSAPIVEQPQDAAFALIGEAEALDDFTRFAPGSDEHPETSTTLIVEVGDLQAGPRLAHGVRLRGPGIQHSAQLQVSGVQTAFWQQLARNHALFPRGVDLILTCGDQLCALPRSLRVED